MAFYTKGLGFGVDYVDGDPLRYAVVVRNDVFIHLSLPESPEFSPGNGRAFVAVQGVDSLWESVRKAVPDAVRARLQNANYGQGVHFKVFVVTDPDGNALRIGEPLQRNE